MSSLNTLILAAIAVAAPSLAQAASVELKNLYATVEVIPEDRVDIAIDMHAKNGGRRLPTVTRSGDHVVVDGGIHWMTGCKSDWDIGRQAVQITLHTPHDVHLSTNGSVSGAVRPAKDLDLVTAGCGKWSIGDVSGAFSIHQSGVANIQAGATGSANLELSGVTHLDMAATRNLTVEMSGAGRVKLRSVSGPVKANLSGVGSVDIASGRADHVSAEVSGMGGFALHGSAQALDAEVSGIGNVRVDHVDGPIHKSVSGIGHINVGA